MTSLIIPKFSNTLYQRPRFKNICYVSSPLYPMLRSAVPQVKKVYASHKVLRNPRVYNIYKMRVLYQHNLVLCYLFFALGFNLVELKKWIIKIAVRLVEIVFVVQYFCFPKLPLHVLEPFIKECLSST